MYYNLAQSLKTDLALKRNPDEEYREADLMFPIKGEKGYYRQVDQTTYCMLLCLINAQIFYGVETMDIHGKDRFDWLDLLVETGTMEKKKLPKKRGEEQLYGYTFNDMTESNLDVAQLAHYLDLYAFPVITSFENIKDFTSRGACVSLTSLVGEHCHSYLIIGVKGKSLICVNYDFDKKKTIKTIPWKKIVFADNCNEHLYEEGMPTNLTSCSPIVPGISPSLMSLINEHFYELLQARCEECYEFGKRERK